MELSTILVNSNDYTREVDRATRISGWARIGFIAHLREGRCRRIDEPP